MPDVNNSRPRVLVAEPDPETAALLTRQLEWAGYAVTTVGNGRDAIELITRLHPAAAVLEVTMDMMTGYEVVRRLRQDPRNRLMAALLISARAGKLDRDFAFTVGADEYVKKPFLPSELVGRLARLVPSPDAPTPAAKPIAQPIARRATRPLQPLPAFAR
jgi:CheY-like chemotaxis protein